MIKDNRYIFPPMSENDIHMPILVRTVGYDIINNTPKKDITHTYRPCGLSEHQFLFTQSGEATVILNGSDRRITKDTFMYHAPHTPHDYQGTNGVWTSYWITFSLRGDCTLINQPSGLYKIGDPSYYIKKIKSVISKTGSPDFSVFASACVYEMIARLSLILNSTPDSNSQIILKPSVEYIHKNFTNTIELKTLSQISDITPNYYCTLFKSCYGVRPVEYVRNLRLQLAKSLLITNQELTISQIAEISGFRDTSYFIKHFKSQNGCSPLDFRKKNTPFR